MVCFREKQSIWHVRQKEAARKSIQALSRHLLTEPIPFPADWRLFLTENVNFYKVLSEAGKKLFEQRIILFLNTTEIVGNGLEVTEEDGLLSQPALLFQCGNFQNGITLISKPLFYYRLVLTTTL